MLPFRYGRNYSPNTETPLMIGQYFEKPQNTGIVALPMGAGEQQGGDEKSRGHPTNPPPSPSNPPPIRGTTSHPDRLPALTRRGLTDPLLTRDDHALYSSFDHLRCMGRGFGSCSPVKVDPDENQNIISPPRHPSKEKGWHPSLEWDPKSQILGCSRKP